MGCAMCSVVSNSFATICTVARQAPLSMGFSRQEYWSGLSCPPPGDLPDPNSHHLCLLHCWWIYPLIHQGSSSSMLVPCKKKERKRKRTSLMAQWLSLCTSNAGFVSSIPAETKIPHATWLKKKEEKEKNSFKLYWNCSYWEHLCVQIKTS